MRSDEFVRLFALDQLTRSKSVASLYFDIDDDTMYSYGKHYPLLVRLKSDKTGQSLLICNDRGYSATTGKHISYARQYADGSVNFKLSRYDRPAIDKTAILGYIADEINYNNDRKAELSKRAWRQRQNFDERNAKLSDLKSKIDQLFD